MLRADEDRAREATLLTRTVLAQGAALRAGNLYKRARPKVFKPRKGQLPAKQQLDEN